jgi:hypothetical protein
MLIIITLVGMDCTLESRLQAQDAFVRHYTGVWAELMAANMWPIHVVLAGYWPNMSEVVVDQYSASIRSIGRILAGYWIKYWANIGKSLFLKGARVRPRPQLDHFAFDIARPSRARSN